MPWPAPHYQPQFTEEQLAEARKVGHAGSAPFQEVIRARIALAVHARPAVSHTEIAAEVGCDAETVYKWRKRWCRKGWSLKDAPRPGRRRVFPP